jgi:recombination associated protein RdgC
MDVLALMNEKIFLGQEFLTWLWYVSEEQGSVQLGDGRLVDVLMGERLVLSPMQGQEGTRVTVKGRESSLAEARQGLKRGKLVESLRLGLMIDGEEYWLTLEAAELGLKSLKLPPTAPGGNAREDGLEGLVLERVSLVDAALRGLEGLLMVFLTQRLADERGGELWAALKAWAAGSPSEG